MWSIYRLYKARDVSVGIIGGADGPTNVYVTRSAATVDVYQSAHAVERVYIEDEQSLNVVEDIIAYYKSTEDYGPGADMSVKKDYFCLTDLDGKNYYVYDNGTETCMQTMSYGDSLVSLPQQYFDSVQALWESHKE